MRPSGRAPDQMREVRFEPGFTRHAEGSCLVSFGDTRVLVTASVEDKVPPFLRGKGQGWVTAEYGMLPRATHTRGNREAAKGKQSGRTQEIQRLIGRIAARRGRPAQIGRAAGDRRLRRYPGRRRNAHCIHLRRLGRASHRHRQAAGRRNTDRGSRSAPRWPRSAAAFHNGQAVLDLDYDEDSQAGCDGNFVLTGDGAMVEAQLTAEGECFDEEGLLRLLRLARMGCDEIFRGQLQAVGK